MINGTNNPPTIKAIPHGGKPAEYTCKEIAKDKGLE